MIALNLPSPLQSWQMPLFEAAGLEVFIKRDDLIHPIISGNKWRKLRYNIAFAKENDFKGIVSVGGAWSNHIHALAFACEEEGLESIGIIKGVHHEQNLSPTLQDAQNWGMKLLFHDRQSFVDHTFLKDFSTEHFPEAYYVPEGGCNKAGAKGCMDIITELEVKPDYILTGVGTATTMAGLVMVADKNTQVIGVSSLKGWEGRLEKSVEELSDTQQSPNWEILHNYHMGGYAKTTPELLQFIEHVKTGYDIPLEQVYTAKLFMAFLDLVQKNYFKKGSCIVLVHTGGLQGTRSQQLTNSLYTQA